jgi:hypothetical protein
LPIALGTLGTVDVEAVLFELPIGIRLAEFGIVEANLRTAPFTFHPGASE